MLIFQRHSIDNDISTSHSYSYTIVELLVVIVVISVLAAIIITSYVGITERARIATIQADLKNASKQLEIFKTNNSNEDHPSTIDCSSPESSTNTCVRSNSGNSFSYTPYNSASPKSYRLTVTNGSLAYYITTGGSIALVTPPTLTTPTVSGITATAATLGANITGDGGDNMTAYGICWGTTPNPTTNCSEIEQGALTAMSPATVAANTPVKIAVSGDGKSVYAQDSTMITMFSRDTTTGVLTPLSPATINTGDSSAHGLEVTPDGKFVYAYAKNSSNAAYIYMYSRDINTGKLTALSPSTYNAPMYPEGMTMSPDGNYIYALGNNTVYKLTRNTTTGLITSSTQTTVNGQGEIVISPDGLYLYVLGLDAYSKAQISMFSRNISTGALSSLTPSTYNLGIDTFLWGAVISPDGKHMYVTNGNGNVVQMFSRNISNGQISPLSPASISCGIGPYGIDMSDDGKTIYVASGGSNYIKIFSRDATTGLLSPLTVSTKFSSSVDDVSVAPDGKSVYSTNAATLSQFSRDAGVSLGAYTKSTTGLTTGTTYYYRGYATNSKGTSYSPDGTFTTL